MLGSRPVGALSRHPDRRHDALKLNRVTEKAGRLDTGHSSEDSIVCRRGSDYVGSTCCARALKANLSIGRGQSLTAACLPNQRVSHVNYSSTGSDRSLLACNGSPITSNAAGTMVTSYDVDSRHGAVTTPCRGGSTSYQHTSTAAATTHADVGGLPLELDEPVTATTASARQCQPLHVAPTVRLLGEAGSNEIKAGAGAAATAAAVCGLQRRRQQQERGEQLQGRCYPDEERQPHACGTAPVPSADSAYWGSAASRDEEVASGAAAAEGLRASSSNGGKWDCTHHRRFKSTSTAAAQLKGAPSKLPFAMIAVVLLLLLGLPYGPLVRPVYGSDLTGTDFPFEGCVQDQRNSPYYATMYSYRENPVTNTSTVCLQINVLSTCTPGKYRCCNTGINKVKVFPALNCRGSVASAVINGNSVMSFYWEEHEGFDIMKITPLLQWFANPSKADGGIVCINLKEPCWQLATFSYNSQLLEYALYDKKVNNYECCPVGTVIVPSASEPSFPSFPPPKRVPPSPPPPQPLPPPPTPPPKKKPPPKPPSPPSPSPSPPPQPPPRRPPSPRPPSPAPPPSKKKSPPPARSPPPSPPPSPSPPTPSPAGCVVTAAVQRDAANLGFSDSTCSLFGALLLLPLFEGATPPTASYDCSISSPSYMVMTISGLMAADVATLFTSYKAATQRSNAVALLGLNNCATDSVVLASDCEATEAPLVIGCESPPPPPTTSSPPPKPKSPPPSPVPPSPPPPRLSPPPSPPPPPPPRPPPPPSPRPTPPSTTDRKPPPPPQSPPPPPSPTPPRIFVYENSAYLLFYSPSNFTSAEATCAALGSHLTAINTADENAFLISSILDDMPPSSSVNVWFGLFILTSQTSAIPGYNTDGTRVSYIPTSNFQYDSTRSAVRYYMLSCSTASGTCAWQYSPSGAADIQPAYLCEFTTEF
ncbi:hypothetical protein Agub_g12817 [Astrephomene gubernaculifera]|uniref:C-type lectin domain-containing protein n=1 Tax=Astrephomene gubernaculifera TaxID=47775 RepID=A0AAD3E1H6_9CHLO|nr:hypothetical protein Agub_g12817 [Astrephomene gubernaculifera]